MLYTWFTVLFDPFGIRLEFGVAEEKFYRQFYLFIYCKLVSIKGVNDRCVCVCLFRTNEHRTGTNQLFEFDKQI